MHPLEVQSVNQRHVFNDRDQFRLVLCGHKAIEVGAVCLVLIADALSMNHITPERRWRPR